ncbi:MAG: DUF3105 domain-containing protein [Thermoleophilaceae bacterium]
MAHRAGRKEALRCEREQREAETRAASERRRLVGYAGAAAIALAALVAIVLLLTAGDAAGCELTDSPGSGAGHTTTLEETVDYGDNPPINGRHYQVPAEDGLYQDPPADEALVHALEHGRVIFWVKPSVPEAAQLAIKALFEEDAHQLLAVPRSGMPYAVAATAWNRDPTPEGTGRTLACEEWRDDDDDALRGFRDEHRSNGPEPVP